MRKLARSLVGGVAAIGLVAVGFSLGSETAVAQSTEDEGHSHESMEAMVDDCARHMDEMGPAMDNMMESEGMGNMMESEGMGNMMESEGMGNMMESEGMGNMMGSGGAGAMMGSRS